MILCRISHNSQQVKLSTKIKVFPSEWDKNLKTITGRSSYCYDSRDILHDIKKIEHPKFLLSFKKKHGKAPDIDDLKKIFYRIIGETEKEIPENSNNLRGYIKRYIREKTTLSESSITKYGTLFATLQVYSDKRGVNDHIHNIDRLWLESFASFLTEEVWQEGKLIKKRYENSSIQVQLHMIGAVLNHYDLPGIRVGKIANYYRPHLDESEMEFLSLDEITKLYNMQLESPALTATKDTFIWCCFTGMRGEDLFNLTQESVYQKHAIIGGQKETFSVVKFRMDKTKKVIEVPLNDVCLDIISRYRNDGVEVFGNKGLKNQNPLLPIRSNTSRNKNLTKILKMAGFDSMKKRVRFSGRQKIERKLQRFESITFHASRHSFATYMINNGVSLYDVKSLLGHSSINTTEKYTKIDKSRLQSKAYKVSNMAAKLMTA